MFSRIFQRMLSDTLQRKSTFPRYFLKDCHLSSGLLLELSNGFSLLWCLVCNMLPDVCNVCRIVVSSPRFHLAAVPGRPAEPYSIAMTYTYVKYTRVRTCMRSSVCMYSSSCVHTPVRHDLMRITIVNYCMCVYVYIYIYIYTHIVILCLNRCYHYDYYHVC